VSGQDYFGFPDDLRDYFKIKPETTGQIVIDMTNHPKEPVNGTQIQLFYEDTNSGPIAVDLLPPYHIQYTGPPGIYFIYIFNDTTKCGEVDCGSPYTLTVSYP
jgi:hypothetical protein